MRDRPLFLTGLMWFALLIYAWGIPYSVWIALHLDNALVTDIFDLTLAVVGLIGLVGVTIQRAFFRPLIWRVVFVLLCLEHLNWMVVLPWLGVPQLGELTSGGPVRFVEGMLGVLFAYLLFIYAFKSDFIWHEDGID
jgi:hypothetical protein